jgi:predicted SnoaL-like aldol condensation-catalyzing enzyme
MKKILSLFPIVLLVVLVSCSDDKTDKTASDTMSSDKKENSMAEKNLAASHAVNDAFGTGNTGALDSVIADNFVDHTERGDKSGRDSLKAAIAWMRSDSKDMKLQVVKELADDDYVMSYNRYTGTSSGGMGKPGPYDMQAVEVVRFKDGKAVEHWGFWESQYVMKMMPAPAKMDDKMKSK